MAIKGNKELGITLIINANKRIWLIKKIGREIWEWNKRVTISTIVHTNHLKWYYGFKLLSQDWAVWSAKWK